MSYESQVGLFGELTFLQKVISLTDSFEALTAWIGPKNALHDFIFPSCTVEVKTTTSGEAKIHTRPGQLSPEYENLFICLVRLEASDLGQDLMTKVNCISEELSEEALDLFRDLLTSAGYTEMDKEYYKKNKFDIIELKFFLVEEGFPTINFDSLPKAITEVNYSLDLKLCDDFSTEPEKVYSLIIPTNEEENGLYEI